MRPKVSTVDQGTALLGRLAGLFFEPRAPAQRRDTAATVAVAVAVIAPPADAMAAAAAVGLALVRGRRAAAALVCLRGAGGDAGGAWRAAATAQARRLAVALGKRGQDAHARGPLVVVRLPEAEGDAVAQAARAAAAAGEAPVVLALGRPRGPGFERALARYDRVVLATPANDAGVASLALSRLATDIPAVGCALPAGRVPRLLAAGGFGLTRSMKTAFDQALDGLR